MSDVFFVKRGHIGVQVERSRDTDCVEGHPIALMVEDEAFGNLTRVALDVCEARLVANALLQRVADEEGHGVGAEEGE